MTSPEFVVSPAESGDERAGRDAGDVDGNAVGYGHPPRHTRFPPGVSGNPGGRPKGAQTLARDLVEELQEMVTLGEAAGEEGAPLRLSKQRGILRSLTAKAIAGDARATAMVLDLVQRLIGPGGLDAGSLEARNLDVADRAEASGARERLMAKLNAIRRRMEAAGQVEPEEPGAEGARVAGSGVTGASVEGWGAAVGKGVVGAGLAGTGAPGSDAAGARTVKSGPSDPAAPSDPSTGSG